MKVCTRCQIEQKKSCFGKNKRKKDGLDCKCKSCRHQYYLDNKEYILQDSKERHPIYYENNKETILKKNKRWDKNHLETRRDYKRNYRKNNRKKINLDERTRRENDINFKLSCNLRSRLNIAIKNKQKSGSAVRDLGCSVDFLKLWLAVDFPNNSNNNRIMSWDNYGKEWHIDHIIPLSSFDLTDREQFLKACHYTNLQAMWAEDNLSKNNKIIK